jgi:antitoxin ParD1/3/4
MNVSLTPELEKLINRKVSSGMYHSASEVIREALRLWKEQEALKQIHHQGLRREIMVGLDQIKKGQVAPLNMDAIKAKGRKILLQRRKAA